MVFRSSCMIVVPCSMRGVWRKWKALLCTVSFAPEKIRRLPFSCGLRFGPWLLPAIGWSSSPSGLSCSRNSSMIWCKCSSCLPADGGACLFAPDRQIPRSVAWFAAWYQLADPERTVVLGNLPLLPRKAISPRMARERDISVGRYSPHAVFVLPPLSHFRFFCTRLRSCNRIAAMLPITVTEIEVTK